MSFILGPFTDFQKCRILIFISYEFYHWQSTVLYLLKTRLRNIKGYEKRKLAPPKSEKDVCSSDLGEKEVEELHAELLREVMRKKINLAAIKELQESTFHSRRCSIQELKAPEKNIVDEIVAKFPFFKEHDCAYCISCFRLVGQKENCGGKQVLSLVCAILPNDPSLDVHLFASMTLSKGDYIFTVGGSIFKLIHCS